MTQIGEASRLTQMQGGIAARELLGLNRDCFLSFYLRNLC